MDCIEDPDMVKEAASKINETLIEYAEALLGTGIQGIMIDTLFSSGSIMRKEMWDDLLRSFDLFGEGRYNTNFNMSSLSFEVVHYMSDWELHCNYSTSVVLSQNVYTFVPEFSIYLSWNILPDLSIDRSWEQYGNTWRNN